MKLAKPMLAALLLAAVCASGSVLAHGGGHGHGHGRVSIGIGIGIGVPIYGGGFYGGPYYGGPFYGPRYYGSPYYPAYYPAPVMVSPPPVYVSQPAAAVAPPPPPPSGIQPYDNSPYWYYCPSSSTYYPYVRGCASGWQQITPPQSGE